MPVTYNCPHCGTGLRTANPIRAGRVVNCPKCKEAFTPVPDDAEEAAEPAAGAFKLADEPPPVKGVKPVRAPKPAARPAAPPPPPPEPEKPKNRWDEDEDEANDKTGYGVTAESEEELARIEANKPKFGAVADKFARSLRGPATAKLVRPANLLTAEGFLTGVAGLFLFVVSMWPLVFTEAPPGDEETVEALVGMFAGLMTFGWACVICIGASKMQNLESYTWAIIGSVMGILPLLAGVYSLIVLRDKKVIAGFEEAEAGDSEDDDEKEEGDDEDEDEDEDDEGEEEEEEERPRKRKR